MVRAMKRPWKLYYRRATDRGGCSSKHLASYSSEESAIRAVLPWFKTLPRHICEDIALSGPGRFIRRWPHPGRLTPSTFVFCNHRKLIDDTLVLCGLELSHKGEHGTWTNPNGTPWSE